MASRGRRKVVVEEEGLRGSLHENVQRFLRNGVSVAVSGIEGCSAWVIRLVDLAAAEQHRGSTGEHRGGGASSASPNNSSSVLLHIYEERLVEGSNSVCDQCRNMGER
eukprot:1159114-Pelagomonas_calceolata.AAC.9